jgi:hypothetical protein
MIARILAPALTVNVLLSALACSSEDSDGGADGADAGTGGSSGSSVACDDDGVVDVSGRWAAIARYAVTLRIQQGGVVTTCPVGQAATTTLLLLLDVTPDPADPARLASVSAYPCLLELPTVTASVGDCDPNASNLLTVDIPIPHTFTSHIADIPPVNAGGAVGGPRGADAVTFDRLRFTWGTRDTGDTLPSWQAEKQECGASATDLGRSGACEDTCVDACGGIEDDDADGYPGVTLHVCGTTQDDVSAQVRCNPETPTVPGATLQGRIAMVLRSEVSFAGHAKSSCELTGPFDSSTTYGVVGADVYLTNAKVGVASALKSLPIFDAHADESLLRAIRIDGRHGTEDWAVPLDEDPAAACAVLRARQNELR